MGGETQGGFSTGHGRGCRKWCVLWWPCGVFVVVLWAVLWLVGLLSCYVWNVIPEQSLLPSTEKPELHEVAGHLCNSWAQKSPKTTPWDPPREQHPKNTRTGKMILLFFCLKHCF